MSKFNPEIWRKGNSYADGFSNPDHGMVYICNKETAGDGNFVILSIKDMANIIAAHQERQGNI